MTHCHLFDSVFTCHSSQPPSTDMITLCTALIKVTVMDGYCTRQKPQRSWWARRQSLACQVTYHYPSACTGRIVLEITSSASPETPIAIKDHPGVENITRPLFISCLIATLGTMCTMCSSHGTNISTQRTLLPLPTQVGWTSRCCQARHGKTPQEDRYMIYLLNTPRC